MRETLIFFGAILTVAALVIGAYFWFEHRRFISERDDLLAEAERIVGTKRKGSDQ